MACNFFVIGSRSPALPTTFIIDCTNYSLENGCFFGFHLQRCSNECIHFSNESTSLHHTLPIGIVLFYFCAFFLSKILFSMQSLNGWCKRATTISLWIFVFGVALVVHHFIYPHQLTHITKMVIDSIGKGNMHKIL